LIVIASARPCSGYGGCSAAITANSVFGSAAPCGAPRRLGHRRGARVDADHEHVGLRRRSGQHRAAVTGAQIERHRGVA
jgi:hypothetical protein